MPSSLYELNISLYLSRPLVMMVTHFLSVPGAWLYVTVIVTVRAGPAASHCTDTTLPEVAHMPVTQPGVQPVQATSAPLQEAGGGRRPRATTPWKSHGCRGTTSGSCGQAQECV